MISRDFLKVKLLSVYNILHNFDIICISESYLKFRNSVKRV